MKRLLEHHVEMLRLREEAPWPSKCRDTREMIKEYQRGKRMRLVAGLDRSVRDRDSDPVDDLAGDSP